MLRRKQIYEELYPETKQNATFKGNQYSQKTETDFEQKPSFVADTSEKTGRSETVIKEELQIAKNLELKEKKVIREADLPKTDAIQLARMPQEERKPIAKGGVKMVKEVQPKLENRRQTMEKVETLTIQQVSEILGRNPQFIRQGIIQGTIPIGAVVRGEGKASFIIPKARFEKWVNGDDMGRTLKIEVFKVNPD